MLGKRRLCDCGYAGTLQMRPVAVEGICDRGVKTLLSLSVDRYPA
jgi:hypothetical protein